MNHAGAEDKGKKPENNDQKYLNHGDQNEKNDVNGYRELESVYEIKVGEGLVVEVKLIDSIISLLILFVLLKVDCYLSKSLDILGLLVIVEVELNDSGESCLGNVWVKSHW